MFYLDTSWLQEPKKYTTEDYKRDLARIREKIKNAPEYYGPVPSKSRDYQWWKRYLKSKINA